MPLRIGITGGIGSGKSIIGKILESLQYPVFYSDAEAKRLVESNTEVKNKIIHLLGESAYIDGTYNRAYVADKVFNDQLLLSKLSSIIHPAVRKAFDEYAQMNSFKSKLIFNEAAILFETDGHLSFDKILLVCSPIELRMNRLKKRDGSTEEQIVARMKKQWSDERKREFATDVIENDEQQSILIQLNAIINNYLSLTSS